MTINENVKKTLNDNHINFGKIATLLGKTNSCISLKLNGKRKFSANELKKIADFINVPIEKFYEGVQDEK